MIPIAAHVQLDESELHFSFMRSSGPGGQNVNKVETAVLLRFNVLNSSSINQDIRVRLLEKYCNKLTKEGDLLIKANSFRTQDRNKQDAIERLVAMIKSAVYPPKKRKKTKPTKASKERRLEKKRLHSKLKMSRKFRINDE